MDPKCKCDKAGACAWHGVCVDQAGLKTCLEGQTPQGPEACMHLRESHGDGTFRCSVYEKCQLVRDIPGLPACADCGKFVPISAPPKLVRKTWVDTLRVSSTTKEACPGLRNLLKGRGAFLVLGGPSAKTLPLERLTERGIFSMAVNNVAASVRTNAFVCSDPPEKFHNGIWTDPSVMKFIPEPKLRGPRGRLRKKLGDGQFQEIDLVAKDCPNVWAFQRRSWLSPDRSWFICDGAAWGNHNDGQLKTGQPKTVGTILLGLRLLQYLGARSIFLVGCDFWMNPNAGLQDNYAFKEDRDVDAIHSNNNQYKIMNQWLIQLRPVFEEFGFMTYNCNQNSRLTAFDFVPFTQALEFVRGNCPTEPYDCAGWYKK